MFNSKEISLIVSNESENYAAVAETIKLYN